MAEHLFAERAAPFVSFLTGLADTVLFSAAVPSQGGTHHVNEQWPSYWVKLFAAQGYVAHDWIRQQIWNDAQIPFWYRQNILVLTKGPTSETPSLPLDLIHPELYLSHTQPGVKGSFSLFLQAVIHYMRKPRSLP